jgi:hypothetical protein
VLGFDILQYPAFGGHHRADLEVTPRGSRRATLVDGTNIIGPNQLFAANGLRIAKE